MASLDQQMNETQKQIVLTQQKMADFTARLDSATAKAGVAEPSIDIANATLADVAKNRLLPCPAVPDILSVVDDQS